MKTAVGFIHTSSAAISPIMRFYSEAAPELEITNLLDDGILRFLSAGNIEAASARVDAMITAARDVYGARMALVTCSSISTEMVRNLQPTAGIPLIKIDDPMAEEAVQCGSRIGVAITFAPTTEPTQRLLQSAARKYGKVIETVPSVIEGAYNALLSGHAEEHDELLVDGVRQLQDQGVDGIVLAQVSMARVLPLLEGKLRVPVFSSLTSSLGAIRQALAAPAGAY